MMKCQCWLSLRVVFVICCCCGSTHYCVCFLQLLGAGCYSCSVLVAAPIQCWPLLLFMLAATFASVVALRTCSFQLIFRSFQFSSAHFNSVQFSSAHFNSVQFSSAQLCYKFEFHSVQFNSARFSSVQFSSIQFSSVQLDSVQFSSRKSERTGPK